MAPSVTFFFFFFLKHYKSLLKLTAVVFGSGLSMP